MFFFFFCQKLAILLILDWLSFVCKPFPCIWFVTETTEMNESGFIEQPCFTLYYTLQIAVNNFPLEMWNQSISFSDM